MSTRFGADRAHLTAFTRSAEALARGADLDATLSALLGAATEAVGATRGVVAVQDPDRPTLELAAAIGMDDDAMALAKRAVADPAHPAVVTARMRTATFGRPAGGDSTAVHADLPLVVSRGGVERPVGVATFVWAAPRTFDRGERELLTALADLIAVAVDRGQLAAMVAERSEWFERMAHTDPLTGLANHRTFARILELELARAGRQGGEVSVAIFDVDDFTRTNELAGHAAGDDILRAIASVLAESVRLVDTVARYGGDEFVLVAPGAAGAMVARRVLEALAALAPVGDRRVSACAGVARFPADATTGDDLLAAAAEALGRARESGQGRLVEAGVRSGG